MKSDDKKKKRGRPRKHPEKVDHGVVVKRPINNGPPLNPQSQSHVNEEPTGWDGRFKSVEPMKHQRKACKSNYKWNHPATKAGKISADPELRVMAAKTLLGKCVPDLKAVEVKAQIEERKVLDISRLKDDDLDTIERVLEHAVIDASESGEDEEIAAGVYQELLADD